MTPDQSRPIAETIVLIAAILLLAALVYSIYPVVSPFVIAGALVYLLYPFRQTVVARRLLWLAVAFFLLWFFYSILGLLAPFIIAFLLAYMLDPLVSSLQKRNVPRWASSLAVVLVMIGIVVAALLFVLPIVVQQFQGIFGGLTSIAGDFADLLKSGKIFALLAAYGIPVEKAQEMISSQISPRIETLLKTLFEGIFGFVSGFSSLVLQLINAIIIPFLVFYILKDFPVVTGWMTMLVPRERRERFIELSRRVDEIIGKYLRGAVTVAVIQGLISGLALWAIGVDYALVLGIMSGLLDLIPYVGLLTTLVVSAIVALFSGGPVGAKVVAVVVLFLSQKLLEATVLGPKIIGTQVGLHPVLLILCLLVFGYFLGFVGLLIAVPVTALIIAGAKEWEAGRQAKRERLA